MTGQELLSAVSLLSLGSLGTFAPSGGVYISAITHLTDNDISLYLETETITIYR